MKTVNIRDLEFIRELNYGTYSQIFLVKLDGVLYCYKELNVWDFDDLRIRDRLCEFTEMEFSNQFLVPLYMVESSSGKMLKGYLTFYNKDLVEIEDPFSREERIKLLKSARKNIGIFNDVYGYIHGDTHFGNILCNRDSLTSSILDFDLSLKQGERPVSYINYTRCVQNYLKYFPFDKKIDAYQFNISTFKLLAKRNYIYDVLLKFIKYDEFSLPEMNKDIKRLTKELLLEDTRKPYSGEFIIDYF